MIFLRFYSHPSHVATILWQFWWKTFLDKATKKYFSKIIFVRFYSQLKSALPLWANGSHVATILRQFWGGDFLINPLAPEVLNDKPKSGGGRLACRKRDTKSLAIDRMV
jgi:hypothetical protein